MNFNSGYSELMEALRLGLMASSVKSKVGPEETLMLITMKNIDQ